MLVRRALLLVATWVPAGLTFKPQITVFVEQNERMLPDQRRGGWRGEEGAAGDRERDFADEKESRAPRNQRGGRGGIFRGRGDYAGDQAPGQRLFSKTRAQ